MAGEATTTIGPDHRSAPGWVLAGFFHLGMLAVVASCVYTQQPPTSGKLFYAAVAVLALSLPLLSLFAGRWGAARGAMAPLTALAAAVAYSFAFEPQMAAIMPSAIDRIPMVVWELSPGIGLPGLLLAALAAAVYLATRCDVDHSRARMTGAILTAAGMIIGMGLLMYITLAPVYDLQGGMYTRLLIGRTVEYSLLGLVVLRMYGLRGIGSAPAWYFAAGLLASALRHLTGAGIVQ